MADSSSATPSGQKAYKPLKDQMNHLKRAIHMACPGTMEDREPLFMVFKNEGENCERKLKQLQEDTLGQSVNSKTKAEMKTLKENHGKCCK